MKNWKFRPVSNLEKDIENALKDFHVEIEEDLLEVSAIPAEVVNLHVKAAWHENPKIKKWLLSLIIKFCKI